MKKEYKYAIGALFGCAIIMFILFFVIGGEKKEYKITFDSTGGSTVESQVIVEGNSVTKPTNPTKENHNFVRWEYQNKEYNFDNKVESDMTLKAVWEEIKIEENYYDVEFMVNGETKKLSLTKVTEKDLEGLGFEEKDGYEIKWYVNGEEYDFSEPLTLTANTSIEGKYVKTTLYTVKFNSDGGTSVSSQKVKQNEKATEPAAITKNGYIFDGWYLNNNKFDFNTAITKNITLVAKWTEDPNVKRYEVTFDSDGGSKVDKQRIIENEKAKEPKAPTKDGYKFLGWYSGDKKYDFKTAVTADLQLKAKWEEIIQYTVIFNKNNGTANESKKVVAGSKVSKPKDPTKSGYTFVAWLNDGETFDFNTAINSDITLIASYKEITKYTVTFDSNGGSSVSSQSIEAGKKAKEPTKPTRTDYDFVEWQLNGSKYNFDSAVNNDITLVAKWKEKTHSYKMIATPADEFSKDSILKLYKDNSSTSTEFKSIILGGKTVNPHPAINTNTLRNGLNGSKTIRVILTNDSEVTATIEFQ